MPAAPLLQTAGALRHAPEAERRPFAFLFALALAYAGGTIGFLPLLYVSREGLDAPMRLAAFQRVTLKPGETRRVTLTAEPRVIAEYDTALPGWRIEGGKYRVAIARDAADRSMVQTVELKASTRKP